MFAFIIRRIINTVLIMFGVATVGFFLVRALPGDPVRVQLGQRADEQTVQALREQYGLNKPMIVQYWLFLERLVHGDLGNSIASNRSVLGTIKEKMVASAILAFVSMSLAVLLGIVLGVLSAVKANTWLDTVFMGIAQFGISQPSFVMAIYFVILFSIVLPWFPAAGYITRGIAYLVLPMVVLGIRPLSIIARVTRSSMLDVLGQDYVRTAKAKGLTQSTVIIRHVLRNALNPVATTVGTWLAGLLSGAFFIEFQFYWPGLGSAAIDALGKEDYPMLMGTVLFSAFIFVMVNFLTDILYAYLDPRIKLS
ncbi:MAG: ABC transporter permease [Candidatus Kapabacteria bacterium]|nr:ABC transporter permease [Candidatus Kapabacteria bacterium]